MKINKEVKKIYLILLGLLFVATCVWSQVKVPFKPVEKPELTKNSSAVETYTFDQLNWNTGNQLLGARAEKAFYFSIPKQWQLNQVKLHLIISHSALLRANSSFSSLDAVAMTLAPARLASWIAASPTALAPA